MIVTNFKKYVNTIINNIHDHNKFKEVESMFYKSKFSSQEEEGRKEEGGQLQTIHVTIINNCSSPKSVCRLQTALCTF